jgi:predicted site-specific integrase-resolvase
MLGVAVVTLRRWHAAGTLVPVCRTFGGHRRYDIADVRQQVGLAADSDRKTIAYARVSSHDQAEQLQTQAQRLRLHCAEQDYHNVEVITDLGSGMNYRKKGLKKLILAILRGEVGRIVLVTKDRLLRFGSELLFSICHFFQVEVNILDADVDCTREKQLTDDLVEILTVFPSRMYGSRSRKNLRAIAPPTAA